MTSNFILKLIAALILITSAITKLIFTEPFEFSLVESGMFNWTISPIILKLVIILEFLLATSLLLQTIHSKLISASIILLSCFYLLDIYSKPTSGLYITEFTLSLFSKWITFAGIIYLIIFSIIQIRQNTINSFSRIKNIIVNASLVLITSTPLLALNPIFIDDLQNNDTLVANPTINWTTIFKECENSNIELKENKPTFFAFLSTSCYYCNQSAIKLGISGRATQYTPQIVLVFPGNKKDTEDFIERNHCNHPYIRISKKEFRALAGAEYPAFFNVKNKIETNLYTGKSLNYRELDKLFQLN